MRFFVVALTCAAAFAQPIRIHPANPHYFLYAGKPTVLITSGEHYGAVLNLDFDYHRYLDTLHRDGLNLTRTFSGTYREVPGDFAIASNTLAPARGRFLAPWLEVNGKFDLTKFNPAYFARLKDFVRYAARTGVIVEFDLFCPLYEDSMWGVSPMNARNNVQGIGDVPRADVLALKDARLTAVQEAVVRKIVTELREFDNLYYEICNEPYFGGVTAAFQKRIAVVIAETENGPGKKHLIAQNWANGSSAITDPNPLVSLFNFHYSRPPDSVILNRALDRPIGNNETGFDGSADATYRIQGWDFLVAGGALYNNLDYSLAVGHEDGTYQPDPKTPGGGSAALRRQLGVLRSVFEQLPFLEMSPRPDAATAAEGTSIRVLGDDGHHYLVYLHQGRVVKGAKPPYVVDSTAAARSVTLQLPPGRYVGRWISPVTGAELRRDTIIAPGTVATPIYAEDIALVLSRP